MTFTTAKVAFHRHKSIFAIHLIDVFNFRLRSLVWFLVGTMNTAIILLFWWATLQASNTSDQPTSLPAITSYYLLMLTFSAVTMCHIEEDISTRDIQKGNLYQYLLRPYSYILSKFHEEVVWRLLEGFWAVIVLTTLWAIGFSLSVLADPRIWVLTALSLSLGMLSSFFLKVCLGLLSIWFTNIRGITELYSISEIILAGFIVPLALLPSPLQEFAYYTPFATYVYFPVQILTTALSGVQILEMLGLQLVWMGVFFVLAQILFRRGVRHYTGVSQ